MKTLLLIVIAGALCACGPRSLPSGVAPEMGVLDTFLDKAQQQDTWGKEELDNALKIWADAAGFQIDRPKLYVGRCFSPAYGCAQIGGSDITITTEWLNDPRRPPLLAVLLHEIGHLYGVPHIEDDQLMDPRGVHPEVIKPTPFDVAIAKSAHAK